MIATVVFLIKDNKILLAKKTKKIGVGLWNGYGGKKEDEESLLHCAKRELCEETGGVTVEEKDLEHAASINFYKFDNDTKQSDFAVEFFLCKIFEREAIETDEMAQPTWFDLADTETMIKVYEEMLPADKIFIPKILNGEKFTGEVHFSEDMKSLVSYEFTKI